MRIQTPEVIALARRCFPGYTGRKFEVLPFAGPMRLDSNWSGGSREFWVLLNLGTNKGAAVPENGTPFTPQLGELKELPFNCVLARHNISCGHDLGITLYVHPDNLNQYSLPAPDVLTRDEKIVLVATRTRKSSYAGIPNFRFHSAHEETGITEPAWNAAKASCQARGLLNKAGAITDAGRNAIEGIWNLYHFKENQPCPSTCTPA